MLRIERLRLEASTPSGLYGADVSFATGLNVLRADNSMGKSTCLQGILYALGLEPMLGPRHEIPLPHAMTEQLIGADGAILPVLESRVLLEITNGKERSLTLTRWARSESFDHRLIQVHEGRALTEPASAGVVGDYFVRLRHAATSESGFSRLLADFLGWELPTIIGPDGEETPLYAEIIFPLVFVEQKRGWGGIHVYVPPYAGIIDARRRALEFILGLGVYERTRRRLRLRQEQQSIRERWRAELTGLDAALEAFGLDLEGMPADPVTTWPSSPEPRLMVFTENGERETLDSLSRRLRSRLDALAVDRQPTADEAAPAVERDLVQDEQALNDLLEHARDVSRELALEGEQRTTLTRRVAALKEDEQRYQDALTVKRLGGSTLVSSLEDECPTCHRPLPDVLLAEQLPQPMSLEDNLEYLRQQRHTFEALYAESERAVRLRRRELDSLRLRADQLRRQIRSARATLVAPANAPAEAIVRERIATTDRLEDLRRAEERLDAASTNLEELSARFAEVTAELRSLPDEGLGQDDRRKLRELRTNFVEQLASYGFSSVDPHSLEISETSYQPSLEGIDLGFDLSASDWIRIIWAYLLGLLEVSRIEKTNHPKLVIFDEPRQQSADPVSLESLLQRAAGSREFNEQVLFATSEPRPSLDEMLSGIEVHYVPFDGHVLAPLDPLS